VTPRQIGLLGFLAALWGASYLFIKYALEDFDAGFIVFARTAVASVFILAVILIQKGEAAAALPQARRRVWTSLGLGALAITVPFLLITLGERHVPSGLTAVLIAPASLFVAMFAPLLDRTEVIGREQAGGLVVGLIGVALLVGVETVDSAEEFLGALMILGASVCYALSSFVVKNGFRHMPSILVSWISVTAGALLAIPAGLVDLPDHAPGARAVISVAVLGIGGTGLAFIVFYRLISEVGAGRASLVSYLAPGLSLFYGAVFLDETITVAAIGGLALILAGVALASRRRGAPSPEPVEGICPEPEPEPVGASSPRSA
jgi:drug/metabolite transporter (DMT)-like permease